MKKIPINKSFIIHKDSLSVLKKLSIQQKAGLLDAIANYQLQSELPADNFISIIFEPFLNQFKRDEEKWLNVVDRNKQNIAKRWNTKNTTGKSGLPDDTKNTDSDSKSDSDSDNKNDNKKIIPFFIDAEIWNGFLEMRIKAKAKPTDLAIKGIIKKLQEFEDKKQGWANESLKNSIENNWKGVFEPKLNYQSFKVSKPTAIDTYNALAEKYAREDLENGE